MKTLRARIQLAYNLCLVALTAITAGACSSSSGPAVQQGRIVNTPIEGVAYATETEAGVTDSNGGFTFRAGETIVFSLGDTILASVPAKSELNWFELGGLSEIPVGYPAVRSVQYGDAGEPSLSRLGAIASLLTTIDNDRDSSNGIVISPGVAALFEGVEVSLQYAGSPQYDVAFKRLLRHANRDGVLEARAPRKGAYALQDVYDNHNVDPDIKTSRRSEMDNNNDGIADWIRLMTYSARGRVTNDYIDSDANGEPNILVDLFYNDEGQGVVYAHDNDADGSYDRTRDWQYDEYGDVTRYREDRDGDGTPDFTEHRTTNDDALWIRREVINVESGVHTVEVWTPDADGNRTAYDLDKDGDGTFDVAVFMTYDKPLGPWITRSQDDDRDGTYEQIRERDYDANDRLIRDAIDNGADGSFDWIENYTRDSEGRLLSQTRDTDGDGNLDYAAAITYNADGEATRREFDDDGDGSTDRVYIYVFDANGNNVRFEYDNNGDGEIDQIRTYIYDTAGNRVEQTYDGNADGVIDRRYYHSFSAEGYPVSYETDNNADGIIDRVSTYIDWQPTSIAAYF